MGLETDDIDAVSLKCNGDKVLTQVALLFDNNGDILIDEDFNPVTT